MGDIARGERIAKLRTERGMKQKDLAAAVGMSKSTLCKLEKGKVSLRAEDLEKIAAVLETPIEAFYGVDATADTSAAS